MSPMVGAVTDVILDSRKQRWHEGDHHADDDYNGDHYPNGLDHFSRLFVVHRVAISFL